MRVRVQIGPVFIGSAEKVSGGMFAIGHVVEKEAVVVGRRSELLLVFELFFHQGQRGGSKQECRCHLGGQW
jgi:hypothetical protein